MPIVKLPDGTLVQIPDADEGPSFGEKLGTNLFTGSQKLGATMLNLPPLAARGINWAMDKMGVPNNPKSLLSGMAAPNYMDEVVAGADALGKKEGFQNPIGRAAAEALPGVFLSPGATAAAPLRSAALAAGPAAVGEKVTEEFGPLAGTGAAVLTGGVGGLVTGPRQSVARADIRRELAGQPPEFFEAARRNAADALGAGSTTATAGEMFPGRSGILALTGKTAGQKGGEMLRNQLGGREDDLAQLSEAFLRRLGPEVDPAQVANQAAEAAGGVVETARGIRGQGLRNRLAGQTVDAYDVAQIYNDLLTRSRAATRVDEAVTLAEVAQSMVGQNGQLITDLQQLSLAIKGLKDRAKNPNAVTSAGAAISGEDLRRAIRVAEEGLGQVSVPFREGMADFRGYTNQVMDPLRKGPVGALADKNPLIAGQTPIGRMEALVNNNSTGTTQGVLRNLENPAMTGGPTVLPAQIARALYQQKLSKGSQAPGKTVRGEPGSIDDRRMQGLIQASGNDPAFVTQPLRAADNLKLDSSGSINGLPDMMARQAALRPFRTLDMMMTAKTQRDVNREIARLLGGPLRQSQIDELQRIAMFNPEVRRMLTLRAAGQPIIATGE